ncbi:hypothetical protein [Ruegeria sp. HKCCD8929]|uniref:hypothetical protein n=1 Tax=Ruegeria sp. HKCCD8929 TaxID=2683006 RepID=UPI00148969D6|nr:hypothetical protein [Ruegeria sp. HKCCD8929]
MTRRIEERCQDCGSTEIIHDAVAEWDVEKQRYVLIDTQDGCNCNSDLCNGAECHVDIHDADTGEQLGRAPHSFTYVPKSEADAAWADYAAQQEADRAERDRVRQQEQTIHQNAEALAAAHQEITS